MTLCWLIWIVPPGSKVLAAPRQSATAAAVLLAAAVLVLVLAHLRRRWRG
ncbi:MAG: hypothetical protein ACK5UC_06435 [Planctomycetaceae bacterium]|jgi:hypothetical protein